jgi:hypothetical protein
VKFCTKKGKNNKKSGKIPEKIPKTLSQTVLRAKEKICTKKIYRNCNYCAKTALHF